MRGDASHTALPGKAAERLCQILFVLTLVLLGAVFVRHLFVGPVNHDEVEHAHVGSRILAGDLPYADFRQNHFPLYWLVTTSLAAVFPFSANVVLAGRLISALALVATWALGLRFLRTHGIGSEPLATSAYTLAFLSMVLVLDAAHARPDALAAALCAGAICLVPGDSTWTAKRACMAGVLGGLAIALSPKTLPLVLVGPVYFVAMRSSRDKWRLLAAFGSGAVAGIAPVGIWLVRHGLTAEFIADTWAFNLAYATPGYPALPITRLPLSLLGVLGVVLWCRSSTGPARAAPALLGIAVLGGLLLPWIARNGNLYNFLPVSFAWALGCAYLASGRARPIGALVRTGAAVLLVGYSTVIGVRELRSADPGAFTLSHLQEVIDLGRQAGPKCLAFAPYHPIFCDDVTDLALGWDVIFADRLVDAADRDREAEIWRRATGLVAAGRVDLVLRHSPWRSWERAAGSGLIRSAELAAMDARRSHYRIVDIGQAQFWARPDDRARETRLSE